MNVFELTRALVDIESTTNSEKQVGDFLFEYLSPLTGRYGGTIARMPVEADRFNVLAYWGKPAVTLSTHMDTVPPFFPSREDEEFIWGRGSCDAKGIIAAMVGAAEKVLSGGGTNIALLFVVGEERNSAGAVVAAGRPMGSRYLINGEPTENKLALGSKGALRYEVTARGKLAHSAYPELGESAIEKLLDVLQDVRGIAQPEDKILGKGTVNIGTIRGGRAPNVIADLAEAELMFRLVGDPAPVRKAVEKAVAGRAELREVFTTPAKHLGSVPGIETTVVSFTTDIPSFGDAWGEPLLIGPGTIHVAHTLEERIPKAQLRDAVDIYARMTTQLLARDKTNPA
jgi:acetylornithine deacetylase